MRKIGSLKYGTVSLKLSKYFNANYILLLLCPMIMSFGKFCKTTAHLKQLLSLNYNIFGKMFITIIVDLFQVLFGCIYCNQMTASINPPWIHCSIPAGQVGEKLLAVGKMVVVVQEAACLTNHQLRLCCSGVLVIQLLSKTQHFMIQQKSVTIDSEGLVMNYEPPWRRRYC